MTQADIKHKKTKHARVSFLTQPNVEACYRFGY